MEVKVQCSCGTRYKFDVEPVHGQLPGPVSCPTCGVDGTAAANAIIQQALNVQTATPAAASVQLPASDKPRIRLSIPAQGPAHSAPSESAPTGPSNLQAPVRTPAPLAAAVTRPVAQPSVAKGKFGLGILGAAIGTLIGVGIWLGIFYATEWGTRSFIKLFAIGVGFMAGLGARVLGRDEGSKELGSITAAVAFLGIFAAQYLIAKEQVVGTYKKAANQEYEARVDYAKKALKDVPTGSEQEIRQFLVKVSAEDGDRIKPGDVTVEDVQEFHDKELPELRDLASGKTTKAQYNKNLGADDLEENSGIKLFLALRGLGAFTIGAMILALGTAYKMAATNA